MANIETILCDFAGCQKPFAYREGAFNLCATHGSTWKDATALAREFATEASANIRRKVGALRRSGALMKIGGQ